MEPTQHNPRAAHADGSKVSGEATELSFSAEQWQFVEQHLFRDGWTYRKMRAEFQESFGIDVSIPTWSRIWSREQRRMTMIQSRVNALRDSARNARTLREEAAALRPELGEAALTLIEQAAFDAAQGSQPDWENIVALTRLILKAREQDLDRAKWEEAQRKAALAEEAEKVTSSTLTPEEKAARMKEIFGIA